MVVDSSILVGKDIEEVRMVLDDLLVSVDEILLNDSGLELAELTELVKVVELVELVESEECVEVASISDVVVWLVYLDSVEIECEADLELPENDSLDNSFIFVGIEDGISIVLDEIEILLLLNPDVIIDE